METEKTFNSGNETIQELIVRLENIQADKTGSEGDVVLQKLIDMLKLGDLESAKIFIGNEADKFNRYRDDAVPLIISKLYGGSGSPWFTVEQKMKLTE